MKKAFTLIELLVTSTIIMIMLGVTITYSQKGESINKVNRTMERLSFDMRRVSNLSMQTKQFNDKACIGSDCSSKKICGWGIYFDAKINNSYIVFSDFCDTNTVKGDKQYSSDEFQEIIKLSQGIIIKETNMSLIMYFPPEPRIEMYDLNDNRLDDGVIVVGVENSAYQKTLRINRLGRVDVSN